jgi:hypothetical protein
MSGEESKFRASIIDGSVEKMEESASLIKRVILVPVMRQIVVTMQTLDGLEEVVQTVIDGFKPKEE